MANDLKAMLTRFANALDPKGAEQVASGMVLVGVLDLSRVNPAILTTATQTARKLTGAEKADAQLAGIMARLTGKTEQLRRAATDELYKLLSERLLGTTGPMTPQLLEAMLEKVGADALILVPGLVDSYRRHFASGGKAESFAAFLLQPHNRHAREALRTLIAAEKHGRLLGLSNKLIRLADHETVSSAKQMQAVFNDLKQARVLLGDALFLELLVSKSGARAGGNDAADFARRLWDLMALSKLPDIPAENMARVFRVADRSAVQGPLGELLSFLNLRKRAVEIAAEQQKDVFILLSPRVSSVRISTDKAKKSALAGSGQAATFSTEAELRAAEDFGSAGAKAKEQFGQEFTDGIIATFDSGIFARAIHECKVTGRGIEAIAEQMVKTQEDIETMIALGFRTVFKVDAKGNMTPVSAKDVTKLSGAVLEDGQFILKEADAVVKRIKELADKGDLSAAEMAEELRLHAQRRLKNFKGAEKLVATGVEQASRAAVEASGIALPVKAKLMPYGHEYETVVDLAVKLLGLLPYKQAY